ncbi:hypothetical protein Pst134EB_018495 [Puccinia striiformis f. sp. tritici]|nr:hypothetical protein Pst134EB_018495 [Puccinia striiformis f. sp. tritici]
MVYDIWTPITNRTESSQLDQQPARNSVRRMMNTFESLEVLMSFFEETIVEPDLEFITSFWLPAWTIELIGRIQNLLILRLALKSEWHSGDPSPMSSGNDKLLGLTDPHKFNGCLGLLIGAGQGLEVLDLSQLPLQCLPRSFPNPLPDPAYHHTARHQAHRQTTFRQSDQSHESAQAQSQDPLDSEFPG